MVMINTPVGSFGMDGFLKSNLDICKEAIKDDWDFVILVDGMERGGKSVLAMQMAYYCDPALTIDNVCLTTEEFKKAVINARPYSAIVYDEAFTGLSSRNTMTRINKSLVEMLAEIGQKNLFIFIVCPTFFDLDKYPALWRSKALVHIYTGDGFERGFFRFYSMETKKNLYVYGKKTYNYNCLKADFYGCFTNFYIIDKAAYKKKKADSLRKKEADKDDENDVEKIEWLFRRLQDPIYVNIRAVDKIAILGIPQSTYYDWKARFDNEKLKNEANGED